MESTRAKREIYKAKNGKRLQKTDIIPIINKSWMGSYGNVQSARKAIALRGWNPLNYALLTNKDLLQIFRAQELGVPVEGDTIQANVMTGTAATYLDKMIRESMRNEG